MCLNCIQIFILLSKGCTKLLGKKVKHPELTQRVFAAGPLNKISDGIISVLQVYITSIDGYSPIGSNWYWDSG